MNIKTAKKPKVKFLTLSCDIISLHKYSQPVTCVAAEIETLFRLAEITQTPELAPPRFSIPLPT